MIIKKLTTQKGHSYLIGIEEVGTNKDSIIFSILERKLFGLYYKPLYKILRNKTYKMNYRRIAEEMVERYENKIDRKESLIKEEWG